MFLLFHQLLIGNDNWISQKAWKKIVNPTTLSVMVKDLAKEIWGDKRCAQYSLCGGKSPKTPTADAKPAAPAGAVEAIFGESLYIFLLLYF